MDVLELWCETQENKDSDPKTPHDVIPNEEVSSVLERTNQTHSGEALVGGKITSADS